MSCSKGDIQIKPIIDKELSLDLQLCDLDSDLTCARRFHPAHAVYAEQAS